VAAKQSRKRTFGNVRQLPSGRYQARYVGGDGLQRSAPRTFATKADAHAYLATVQSDIVREAWKAPKHARITLGDYGRTWVAQRPIKASTRERARLRQVLRPVPARDSFGTFRGNCSPDNRRHQCPVTVTDILRDFHCQHLGVRHAMSVGMPWSSTKRWSRLHCPELASRSGTSISLLTKRYLRSASAAVRRTGFRAANS